MEKDEQQVSGTDIDIKVSEKIGGEFGGQNTEFRPHNALHEIEKYDIHR